MKYNQLPGLLKGTLIREPELTSAQLCERFNLRSHPVRDGVLVSGADGSAKLILRKQADGRLLVGRVTAP